MQASVPTTGEASEVAIDRSGLWGHPQGLVTLSVVEMFERFSFYGMKAIMLYHMIAPKHLGGLGFSASKAGIIFGVYCMAVYLMAIPGGIFADRWQGAKRSLLFGLVAVVIAHAILIFHSEIAFFIGLSVVVIGTGLLKPNVSTTLGELYKGSDEKKREVGFFIFYMFINIGAAMAPLIVGYLAQDAGFRQWLADRGFDPNSCWHWGYGATAIGALFAVLQLIWHWDRLDHVGLKPVKKLENKTLTKQALTVQEKRNLVVIGILFFATTLFWTIYEQSGSSLALFAESQTRNFLCGWEFPPSWYATVQGAFVILLCPLFAVLWKWLGKYEPSSPAKFSFGLAFVGLGILVMVAASYFAGFGQISKNWLIAVYFFEVIGEMCLSPVGLSLVTKLAPARLGSTVMGIWFLAAAVGGFLAAFLGTCFDISNSVSAMTFFALLAVAAFVSAAVLYKFTPKINKLMS